MDRIWFPGLARGGKLTGKTKGTQTWKGLRCGGQWSVRTSAGITHVIQVVCHFEYAVSYPKCESISTNFFCARHIHKQVVDTSDSTLVLARLQLHSHPNLNCPNKRSVNIRMLEWLSFSHECAHTSSRQSSFRELPTQPTSQEKRINMGLWVSPRHWMAALPHQTQGRKKEKKLRIDSALVQPWPPAGVWYKLLVCLQPRSC